MVEHGHSQILEDGKVSTLILDQWRRVEQAIYIFSLLCLGLTLLAYEIDYLPEHPHLRLTQEVLLWFVSVSSILIIGMTHGRYTHKLRYLQSRLLVGPQETLFTTGLYKHWLIEWTFLLGHPHPLLIGSNSSQT